MFKEKVDKYLSYQFYSKTSTETKISIKQDNDRFIALVMFYENRKLLLFKVLGFVIYFFLDRYVCVNYFCLQKEQKLSLAHKLFEDTSFDEL